ncbi:hypothetical protein ACKLNO_00070 [Neisseriaceae bacterium B1]
MALQQTLVISAIPRFPTIWGVDSGIVLWLVTSTLLTGALLLSIALVSLLLGISQGNA